MCLSGSAWMVKVGLGGFQRAVFADVLGLGVGHNGWLFVVLTES